MLKKYELPISGEILTQLQEAILFVHKTGEIIKGNKAAFTLLAIEENSNQLMIQDYLDFDLLTNKLEINLLMEQKNDLGTLLDVKSIEVDQSIFCIIINHVALGEETMALKKHIDPLIQVSSEGMVIYSEESVIDCDTAFATLFGYAPSEIKGMKFNNLFDEASTKKMAIVTYGLPESPYKLIGMKKNGDTLHIELMDHPYNNQGSMIKIAIIRDISDRVEHEERLEYMAYYDELTDLPNRNYFTKVLKDAIDQARVNNELLAVYFIDLDYFKEINETLGYDFGDKVLIACGQRINTFKDTNTFISRMGGDEFLIIQRHISNGNRPIKLARDLISEFENPVIINGYEVSISISIGISMYPKNGVTPNNLIKHADSAMYVIKEKHRNNYKMFESSISENFKTMLIMERDLRNALKNKQFTIHYQPQKNLRTKRLIGMEALLRWSHPEKGNIPPLNFIPLAEKTGFIIEIGDWVLEEACRQNKKWQDDGYEPFVVSVNISVKQFHQQDLLGKIEGILTKTGLESKYLELEITESMAMTNEEYILETMRSLRELGVLVSIDDFGTGYSSLKYLSVFPITKLKIDKTFMDKNQEQNRAIVKSIINMSHSLGIKVIAEGVETIDQLQFLEKEKCDEMQGYYFSRPLPPNQLIKFLKLA